MTEKGVALMALMTLAMLLVYFWTAFMVGRARGRLGVKAPATEGPAEFNRLYRAHVNTLEQLVLALPAFWVFYLFREARWTALLMGIWCLGRIIYVLAYARDAEKRGTGFMISLIALAAAVLGSIYYAAEIIITS